MFPSLLTISILVALIAAASLALKVLIARENLGGKAFVHAKSQRPFLLEVQMDFTTANIRIENNY